MHRYLGSWVAVTPINSWPILSATALRNNRIIEFDTEENEADNLVCQDLRMVPERAVHRRLLHPLAKHECWVCLLKPFPLEIKQ